MSTMKPGKGKEATAPPAPDASDQGILRPQSKDEFVNKLNSLNPGDDITKTNAIDLTGILQAPPFSV